MWYLLTLSYGHFGDSNILENLSYSVLHLSDLIYTEAWEVPIALFNFLLPVSNSMQAKVQTKEAIAAQIAKAFQKTPDL